MLILKGALSMASFPDGHVKYIVYFSTLFDNLSQLLATLQQHFTGDRQPAALRRLLLWSTPKSNGFPIGCPPLPDRFYNPRWVRVKENVVNSGVRPSLWDTKSKLFSSAPSSLWMQKKMCLCHCEKCWRTWAEVWKPKTPLATSQQRALQSSWYFQGRGFGLSLNLS